MFGHERVNGGYVENRVNLKKYIFWKMFVALLGGFSEGCVVTYKTPRYFFKRKRILILSDAAEG